MADNRVFVRHEDIVNTILSKNRRTITIPKTEMLVEVRVDTDYGTDFYPMYVDVENIKIKRNKLGKDLLIINNHNIQSLEESASKTILAYVGDIKTLGRKLK